MIGHVAPCNGDRKGSVRKEYCESSAAISKLGEELHLGHSESDVVVAGAIRYFNFQASIDFTEKTNILSADVVASLHGCRVGRAPPILIGYLQILQPETKKCLQAARTTCPPRNIARAPENNWCRRCTPGHCGRGGVGPIATHVRLIRRKQRRGARRS